MANAGIWSFGKRCDGSDARRRQVPPASGVARGQPFLVHSPLRIPGRKPESDGAPPEALVDPVHSLHQPAVLQRPVLEQRSNRIAGRRQVKQHHAGLAIGKALAPEALEYSQRCRDDNAAVGGWRRERRRCGSRVLRGGGIETVGRDGNLQIAADLIGTANFLRVLSAKDTMASRTCPRSVIARLKLREQQVVCFAAGCVSNS